MSSNLFGTHMEGRSTHGQDHLHAHRRSATARRYRDVVLALADDCGGEARLNESQRILIRQAAAESINVEQLTRASNSLSRVLDTLRRPAEVAR